MDENEVPFAEPIILSSKIRNCCRCGFKYELDEMCIPLEVKGFDLLYICKACANRLALKYISKYIFEHKGIRQINGVLFVPFDA